MLLLLSQQPERRIAIVSDTYSLIFKSVGHNKDTHTPLCAIDLVRKGELKDQGFRKLTHNEVHGFIGLIEIQGYIFLGAITGRSKVAQPTPGETVNKIFAVDFFCLNDSRWDFVEIDSSGYPNLPNKDSTDLKETLPRHPCYEIRKLLSDGSFYYSSDFDLTSTLQKRKFSDHSLSVDNFEEEYMWNSFLMNEIVTYRDRLDMHSKQILDDEGFLTTVIRGFAETFVTYVKKLKVGVTVISKQSWKRAGTRFNARGVDDDSNVANFVETEFIMYSSEYCYSFTEIRGSIPIFWEQDTSLINPKVQITRSLEATQPVFDEHFHRLITKYGPVHIVNLLSTKSSEIELSQRYKQHVRNSKKLKVNDEIFYTHFDFHKETAQEGFSAVKKVIPLLLDSILESGYFSYDVREKKVLSEQHGIFRVNCLDCLDRTNLVQQTISLNVFRTFLEDFHIISSKAYVDEEDFVLKHNTLWADHGDQVSQMYTGTNALKSSFSRKGKMSLAGVISDATKSVSRMYINNFMDKGKQQNIDCLLGRLPNQKPVELYDPFNEYMTAKLSHRTAEFTDSSNINIFVGTFNVNGNSRRADLSKWLFPIGDKFKPDIVVLGLQEVIELTAGSILNADYSKGSFWETMVSDCLNQFDEKYLLLRVEQMSSLLILFFVKSDKANNVKQVEGASKKTGFGGMTGNKGAVSIRFDYGSTSFCFVNAHLAAGATNIDERRNDFESITNGTQFTRSKVISHHDSIFWLGDLNYRIQLTNEEVRKNLATQPEGYIDRLLTYDQLTQEINAGVVFKEFKEPTLKFRPTYKYDFGTDTYDSSEKARTPSWTDRIIYKGDNLHPLAYSDAQLLLSDHRPVYAAYRAKVTFIDEDKKSKIIESLHQEFLVDHPNGKSFGNDILLDLETNSSTQNDQNIASKASSLHLDDTMTNSQGSSSSSFASLTPKPKSSQLGSPVRSGSGTTLNTTSVIEKSNRPKLPAPPPPASRALSNAPTGKLTDSNGNTTTGQKTSVPSTPRTSTPISHSNDAESQKSPISTPQVPPKRKVLPPGFNDSMVLTPKNSSQTSLEKKVKTPPPVVLSPKSATTQQAVNSTMENTPNADNQEKETAKKIPPAKPAKKPELEGLTMDTWKPLTPK
ncbi:hypothetical protein RNJ44_02141 [Nakaseomyces bracarensis]|uniref:phosphoinositide 5-phosphatase n=1 Tax=Nakaseomyces bracarensis TaxID=273131 RepID=A0ABR4NML3_9SACH